MEFDVVEGADSSLGDDAGPDGSSEAEMLFTVLRGMWTKPSRKQTEENKEKFAKSTTTVTNLSHGRKTPRKTKKMAARTQHEGKTERAKGHAHANNNNKFIQYYHFVQVLPIKIIINSLI